MSRYYFPQKQYTLLMCAARNNRLSVVNFLLDTIEDVGLDAFDTDHQTALHHAAIAGHTHVVRRLVHAGANTSTTNKVYKNCLYCRLFGISIRLVNFLVQFFHSVISRNTLSSHPSTTPSTAPC